jgi:ribose transport system permease protein
MNEQGSGPGTAERKPSTPGAGKAEVRPGLGSRRFAGRPLSYWAVNYAAVGVLLAFIVFFSLAEPSTFPHVDEFKTIVSTQSVLAILALGVVIPLVVGEFDLSVGNNLSFTAVLSAVLVSHGMGVLPAILVSLLAGAAIGVINALLIVGVRISSFIATLGTGVLLAGFTTWVSGGVTVFEGIGPSFTNLGNEDLFNFLPIGGLYVIVLAIVLWYLLERTSLGRQLYAVGLGRQAALLAGIRTNRRIVLAFVLSGIVAAAAGVLHTANLGSASPGVGGSFLLPAFAAAFVGQTTIRAGRPNIPGTIVGVFLLAVGISGLQLMGAPSYVSELFNGSALIVAVGLSRLGARRAQTIGGV